MICTLFGVVAGERRVKRMFFAHEELNNKQVGDVTASCVNKDKDLRKFECGTRGRWTEKTCKTKTLMLYYIKNNN